ncbi:MAG: hypothetical protein AAGF14_09405 [Pseudomonadota bacterium]
MLRLGFLLAALFILCVAGPGAGSASEKQGAADEAKKTPVCHKKISIKGRPHRISSVASLSAIRMWSQMAMKHGDSYSMWHNAKSTKVSCEKLPRSDYFACYAEGKPCQNSGSQASAASN